MKTELTKKRKLLTLHSNDLMVNNVLNSMLCNNKVYEKINISINFNW